MKKLALARLALTFLLATGSAMAADMRVKAPPPPPPPTWTGFYVGINGGYGSSDTSQVGLVANDPYTVLVLNGGFFQGGVPVLPPGYRLQGAVGGVQAGYNWQVNPHLLVGLEADFDGSSIRGTGTTAGPVLTGPIAGTGTAEQRIRWFGTARARLGFLPTSNWLIYGTGGLAYGRIDESMNYGFFGGFAINGFGSSCAAGVPCWIGASSRTASGWTAGGGTEFAILPNFTVKAEYLYVRLGDGDSFNVVAQATPNPQLAPGSFRAVWGTADFHTVRLGFNYKFNSAAAVVAKY